MVKVISHRLYFSNAPSAQDRGIKCYSKCLGTFLSCFKISSKYVYEGKTYFVNAKSLKKYVDPGLQPVLSPLSQILKLPLYQKFIANFPEVVSEMKAMPLDQFVEEVKNENFLVALASNSKTTKPLFSALNSEKRGELLYAILRSKYPLIPLMEIAGVWTKDEAMIVRSNFDQFPYLLNNDSQSFILNAMTLEEFQTIFPQLSPQAMGHFLAHYQDSGVQDGEAKMWHFFNSRTSLPTLSDYLEELPGELKGRWIEQLKKEPKQFFNYYQYQDQKQLGFIKDLLDTMTPNEVKVFTESNPFIFSKDSMGFQQTELFKYLIKHLDSGRASHFISGLWDREGVNDQFCVENLAAIYSALKDDEEPEIYSENLKSCLEAVLMWFEENLQWHHFLGDTMDGYLDAGGPNNQAFKALLTMAVILGIRNPGARPLLDRLIRSNEGKLIGFEILGENIKNPTLMKELSDLEKQILIELAITTSNIFKQFPPSF